MWKVDIVLWWLFVPDKFDQYTSLIKTAFYEPYDAWERVKNQ